MSCPLNPNNKPEIWKRLNQFLKAEKIDPMALEQFKNQVKSLLELKVLDVYLALGTIASLEDDIDNVHHYYQQAIELFSRKANILASYADSLSRISRFSAATDLMLEAYYLLPGGIDYLAEAIHLCGVTGRFHLMSELLRIKTKVSSFNSSSFEVLVSEIVQFMDETQVTDEELENLINITLTVLHRYHIIVNPQQISFSMEEDDYSKWFRYAIQTKELPKGQIVQLISEVADELFSAGLSHGARTHFLPMLENAHS